MARQKLNKVKAPRKGKDKWVLFSNPTAVLANLACVAGVLALILTFQGLKKQDEPVHVLNVILEHLLANTPTHHSLADTSNFTQPREQSYIDIDRLFTFNEGSSVYFKDNIAGLRSSVELVFEQGCFDSYNITYPPSPMHVVFDARNPPITSDFIQIQLEQTASSYFTKSYLKKLSKAVAVWEFSLKNVEYMQKYLPRIPHYVPSSAYLNVPSPTFQCNDSIPYNDSNTPKGSSFTVYEHGFYLLCQIKAGNMMHVVSYRRSISWSDGGPQAPPVAALQPRPFFSPDVLFYGQIEGSYQNSRENTCDMLQSAGIAVLCLQDVFGDLLEYFVCQSKVVLSNQYYKDASLGTHRIDPLLLAGKLVVAEPSADRALDSEYASAVVFSNRKKLTPTLRKILQSWNKYSQTGPWISQFMLGKWQNVQPLCIALRALPAFANAERL